MDALERASSNARSSIEEVLENANIRKVFNSFFVANQGVLYARDRAPWLKDELAQILSLNRADAAPIYRGLFVELHGVFERYVAAFSAACVDRISSSATKYSDVEPNLRKRHTAQAGQILSHYRSGTLKGIKYDFDGLMKKLSVCFSDAAPPRLDGGVLTAQMGGCTPEKLDDLFGALNFGDAFDDELGRNAKIKALPGNSTGARAATKRARELLDDAIDARNQIVHDHDAALSLTDDDVKEFASLLLALIDAFETKARRILP